MSNTEDLNPFELARQLNEVTELYERSMIRYMFKVKPLDIEEFWPIVNSLAGSLPSSRPLESEVHNLFCSYVYGSSYRPKRELPDTMQARWELMASFVKRYEHVKAALSKKCWDMPGLERGDDGYGDLIDSLPLAGKKVFDGIMEDDIANYKQLKKALDGPLANYILNGENYIEMNLDTKLKESFRRAANSDD